MIIAFLNILKVVFMVVMCFVVIPIANMNYEDDAEGGEKHEE